ncbi:patatin-like phospholipase family protein [Rhodospirillum rubrum]|uniref:Patatin n=1 Tax=Rhodospirillum rubrum (strain ATCC 11170 / ATH 1.1.1 / DSM 467 / LMG 4362 / NCIMB 8255 / S1) TaxID=269796 RepID=Q2RVK6_RHORT|nr:patatin-like phospholipase family protein [Rhodospirillum rubrum]ABC21839.1 Patatin [Rhodospirillum rubrum ATCC 11170]AEO47539.1 patatin [Rhodospirillum rubrum F11]MBK5953401.1 patatin [Rhodospirillum rubrum]QXG81500.1 patatin-like phospholipase family protein [Rhodospirillum rubrum]HAP98457.1 patatin-like phospholipase family protein [Rhodospirillum rubrum]
MNTITPISTRRVTLALQGGGSHGAFTWGVLDRLLEEPRLRIEAVSGTSAGAMNAACLAHGLADSGRQGARDTLERFWTAISNAAAFSPIRRSPLAIWLGNWSVADSMGYLMSTAFGRALSPYQSNPLNINPLRETVERIIDFDAVRACRDLSLFVTATNVHTGRPRIFTREDLSVDAVLASACLPHLFQAVEIDGVPYWDGGYVGNPALWPLIYETDVRDLLLVRINPLIREQTPMTGLEIADRLNEITFNASMFREMRAIAFVGRMLDEGSLDPERYKRMLIHAIEAEDDLKSLGASSKLNAELPFLFHLRDIGRRAADDWLTKNLEKIGYESTVDVASAYL